MSRTVINTQESGVDGFVFANVFVKLIEKLCHEPYIWFWSPLSSDYRIEKPNCVIRTVLFPDSGTRMSMELNIVTGMLLTVSIESDIYGYRRFKTDQRRLRSERSERRFK